VAECGKRVGKGNESEIDYLLKVRVMDMRKRVSDEIKQLRRMRKRIIRERKMLINAASEFIVAFCPREYKSREDLLSALEELKKSEVSMVIEHWDGGRFREVGVKEVAKFISEASDETVKEVLERVNKKVKKEEYEWKVAKQLEERLNKDAPPGLEIEIHDLTQLMKGYWGIKVTVGANTHLFEFEGSIDELAEVLLELRKEQEKDYVMCPFCRAKYLRAFAMKYLKECSCSARVVVETAHDCTGLSPELERLWEEGCSALGIPLPEDWYRIHIDDFFANVKYAGKGTTSWRMWFVKKPWQLRVKVGSSGADHEDEHRP
jgi:hypothetical protein